MTLTIDVISWLFVLFGSFFAVIGGIGIIRMPEFFSRMHAAGITDTMGAGLIILGLIIYTLHDGPNLISIKLLLILFFSLVVSPSSCHALARSAIVHGVKPVLDVKPNDGADIDP